MEYINEFERIILLAKARAYSKVSLERPLSNYEFQEYQKLIKDLH